MTRPRSQIRRHGAAGAPQDETFRSAVVDPSIRSGERGLEDDVPLALSPRAIARALQLDERRRALEQINGLRRYEYRAPRDWLEPRRPDLILSNSEQSISAYETQSNVNRTRYHPSNDEGASEPKLSLSRVPEGAEAIALLPGQQLCEVCKIVLLSQVAKRSAQLPVLNYSQIEKNVSSGCPTCGLFVDALPIVVTSQSTEDKDDFMFVRLSKMELEEEGDRPCLKFEYRKMKSKGKHNHYFDNRLYHDDEVVIEVRLERDSDTNQHTDPTNTTSLLGDTTMSDFIETVRSLSSTTDRFPLTCVQNWLKNCADHIECRNSYYLPTRLIEISKSPSLRLRLCDGASLDQDNIYMTLSHCWGIGNMPRLLEDDLTSMQKSILFEDLPKTFQDAVIITQKLGCTYLWIDALCIIQDSREDWRVESAKMGMVYAHSYCNLSATTSRDSAGGFSISQRCSKAEKVRLRLRRRPEDPLLRRKQKEVDYYAYSPQAFSREVNSAPLNGRGWVLQERLLSRRNLQFGENQLYWECCKLTACETFPRGIPTRMNGDVKRRFATVLKRHESPSLQPTATFAQMQQVWGDLVQTYCNCALTFAEDRLVAISGLASNFHTSVGSQGFQWLKPAEPDYLAGLWNHDLVSQLLWKVNKARNPGRYIAPSWSWAAIEGEFDSLFKPEYSGFLGYSKDVVTVEETRIQHLDHSLPFGQVTAGSITLRGKLAVAKYYKDVDPKKSGLRSLWKPQNLSFYDEMLSVSWDVEPDLELNTVYLLPLRGRASDLHSLDSFLEFMNAPRLHIAISSQKPRSTTEATYTEGLILEAVNDPLNHPPDQEYGSHGKIYRRVGKWETLAVDKLKQELGAVSLIKIV